MVFEEVLPEELQECREFRRVQLNGGRGKGYYRSTSEFDNDAVESSMDV